jgi:hypothetical protein
MSRLPSRFLSRPTRRTFSVLVFLSVLITTAASAKRIAPKPEPPIIRDGVLYSAPNDNGRIEYVSASDAKTKKKLWDIKIYESIIDPNLEEDVQWVFITDLRLAGHFLLVKDERFRCYRINIATEVAARAMCLASRIEDPVSLSPQIQFATRHYDTMIALARGYELH